MVVGSDSLAHQHKIQTGVRERRKSRDCERCESGGEGRTSGGTGLEDGAKSTVEKPEAGAHE